MALEHQRRAGAEAMVGDDVGPAGNNLFKMGGQPHLAAAGLDPAGGLGLTAPFGWPPDAIDPGEFLDPADQFIIVDARQDRFFLRGEAAHSGGAKRPSTAVQPPSTNSSEPVM